MLLGTYREDVGAVRSLKLLKAGCNITHILHSLTPAEIHSSVAVNQKEMSNVITNRRPEMVTGIDVSYSPYPTL